MILLVVIGPVHRVFIIINNTKDRLPCNRLSMGFRGPGPEDESETSAEGILFTRENNIIDGCVPNKCLLLLPIAMRFQDCAIWHLPQNRYSIVSIAASRTYSKVEPEKVMPEVAIDCCSGMARRCAYNNVHNGSIRMRHLATCKVVICFYE